MFRLATLLALGTSYLLVFAWIEEASALDVTVSVSCILKKAAICSRYSSNIKGNISNLRRFPGLAF